MPEIIAYTSIGVSVLVALASVYIGSRYWSRATELRITYGEDLIDQFIFYASNGGEGRPIARRQKLPADEIKKHNLPRGAAAMRAYSAPAVLFLIDSNPYGNRVWFIEKSSGTKSHMKLRASVRKGPQAITSSDEAVLRSIVDHLTQARQTARVDLMPIDLTTSAFSGS